MRPLNILNSVGNRKQFLLSGVLLLTIALLTTHLVLNPITTVRSEEEKHTVPLDQIVSGGPPPDGILSIDSPKFVSLSDGNKFLEDTDKVVGIKT